VLAHCPAHDDSTPSLSLTEKADGTLLWKCFAGCSQDAVREALERLAGVQPATARPIAPRRNRQQPATAQAQPLTLAALADAKRLDAEKLIAWHVRELPDGGIEILYLTREGELHAVQYRCALEGDNRFKWRKDDTAILYGLWRLPEWGDADTLYLCEGTSDTWTLWHADLPALGIPSASTWEIRVVARGGGVRANRANPRRRRAGAGWCRNSPKLALTHLQERVQVLQLPEGVKDANELWQQVDADPERFREALAGCNIWQS
jgi:putative DNA primase/helicase